MKRQFAREYPHQIRLPNTGGWRAAHATHALRGLRSLTDWRWWTEGRDISGDLVSVWGFKDIERVVCFEMWATSAGIDWSVPPTEQPPETRPPQPAEEMSHVGLAIYRIKPDAGAWRETIAIVTRH